MTGKEVYTVDCTGVSATGVALDTTEVEKLVKGPVKALLADDEGLDEIRELVESSVPTGFDLSGLEPLLSVKLEPAPWLVGEALAEVFVAGKCDCVFPWPTGRDLRNSQSSPAGADLVGFQQTGDSKNPYRFAFGEVKTSGEAVFPPQVVTGRSGLQKQMEDLRDSLRVKRDLFRYLGFHAAKAHWKSMFESAAHLYLGSEYKDASLFGVLIRDVAPNHRDLESRAEVLSLGKPSATSIEMYAIYIPEGTIPNLPFLLKAAV